MKIITKKKPIRILIELFCTLLGWIYLILFLNNLFQSFSWNFHFTFSILSINNVHSIVMFTILTILCSSGIILFWVMYNKKKYGQLNRRRFPNNVSAEGIAEHFGVSRNEVLDMQNQRWIER